MTRLFLAAGVAALAIAAPASAKPGGNGGHGGEQSAAQVHGGGHGGGNVEARGGSRGGGGGNAIRMQSRGGGDVAVRGGGHGSSDFGFQRRGGGGIASPRMQRQAFAFQDRGHGRGGGSSMKMERRNVNVGRTNVVEQRGHGGELRTQRFEQRQARNLERQQVRGNQLERVRNQETFRGDARANREAFRDELRANRIEHLDNGVFVRDARLGTRTLRAEDFGDKVRGYGIGGCPPGLMDKGCMPPGQAAKLLGTRFSDAERIASLGTVPYSVRYLYPDTNDFYYRYGDGYMYRVDRGTSLIDALLPLAFGGYMPGSYFPSSYMNSYVPDYYGLNSFYPASYGYGSPYGYGNNTCNRYANGVVYQVDCMTGFVENVIPMYAGGYGVGQMLPTGYGYYNVPYQYRDMYYDTSDSGYWYAPGAIYQYDPSSSMITSVAALLSPGFSVGQQLPYGYDAYNVPYDYRATYYDTPDAWYRYNNGGIYRVDPTTQLVTALVASILR